jgi:pectinesterase
MKKYLFLIWLMLFLADHLNAQDKYEITVALDGSGDYQSIQAAIDASKAFPNRRVVIRIKNGTYYEKIVIPECNTQLSLIGESHEGTVISGNDYFDRINRGRNSTFYTYTVKVEADDFYAENLTIENTAGPVGQAIALYVEGNRCTFNNCKISGHQDTLYTSGENSRQYFTHCLIEGTTDFIFGAATVLFDDCTINSRSNSYITAASTTKGKVYGFVFLRCRMIADEKVSQVYLGRPWRDYARVVFIYCEMGAHILPEGWANWDKTNRDKTAYYAEYRNTGPGASTGKRVSWSHQLTDEEASAYLRGTILGPSVQQEPAGDSWVRTNSAH